MYQRTLRARFLAAVFFAFFFGFSAAGVSSTGSSTSAGTFSQSSMAPAEMDVSADERSMGLNMRGSVPVPFAFSSCHKAQGEM